MLKFKDSITPEQQATLVAKYTALTESVPTLKGFEWGSDFSAQNKHPGYTHVFVTTFESEEARKEYVVHPVHAAFAEELRGAVENLIIFPFTTTVTLKAPY